MMLNLAEKSNVVNTIFASFKRTHLAAHPDTLPTPCFLQKLIMYQFFALTQFSELNFWIIFETPAMSFLILEDPFIPLST